MLMTFTKSWSYLEFLNMVFSCISATMGKATYWTSVSLRVFLPQDHEISLSELTFHLTQYYPILLLYSFLINIQI